MKCPKCGYTSFPYLENCRKCGTGLATQRAAMGLYGLPPDPPDLRLAYRAIGLDFSPVQQSPSSEGPDLDMDQPSTLDLIEPPQVSAGNGPDTPPLLDQEWAHATDSAPSAVEPPALPRGGAEEGIVFDLKMAEAGIDSPATQPGDTPQGSEEPRVYDLDLVEDLGGLNLEPLLQAGQPEISESDSEEAEYTLEIEDEVEFEIEELEVDQSDDDTEDDDDDC